MDFKIFGKEGEPNGGIGLMTPAGLKVIPQK